VAEVSMALSLRGGQGVTLLSDSPAPRARAASPARCGAT
jgi:hypothetical protein